MVAFNFRPCFVDKILSGHKLSTIRSTRRCDLGDMMQLYVGQRTKSCRLIMASLCVGVAPILISDHSLWLLRGIEGDVRPCDLPLHEQEGFDNSAAMLEFFREEYGLPYRGFIHAWMPMKSKAAP